MLRTYRRNVTCRRVQGPRRLYPSVGRGFVASELMFVVMILALLGAAIVLAVPADARRSSATAGDRHPVRSLATAGPDGRFLVVLSDGSCLAHDLIGGDVIPIWLRQGNESMIAIAGSPAASRALICGIDGGLHLVDLATGETVWNAETGGGLPLCAAFSPDGAAAAVCTEAGEILLLDAETGHERSRLSVNVDASAVCFTVDGKSLIAPDSHDTLAEWDAGTGELRRRYEGSVPNVSSIAISSDGNEVAAATCEGDVLHWQYDSGRLIARYGDSPMPALAVAWSPESQRLIYGSMSGTIHEAGGNPAGKRDWFAHPRGVRDLVFVQGHLISAGYDGRVLRWSADRTTSQDLTDGW